MQEVLKMNDKYYEVCTIDTDGIKVTLPKSIIKWLGGYCDEDEKERRQRIITKYLYPKIQAKVEYAMYKQSLSTVYGIMCKGGFVK